MEDPQQVIEDDEAEMLNLSPDVVNKPIDYDEPGVNEDHSQMIE